MQRRGSGRRTVSLQASSGRQHDITAAIAVINLEQSAQLFLVSIEAEREGSPGFPGCQFSYWMWGRSLVPSILPCRREVPGHLLLLH